MDGTEYIIRPPGMKCLVSVNPPHIEESQDALYIVVAFERMHAKASYGSSVLVAPLHLLGERPYQTFPDEVQRLREALARQPEAWRLDPIHAKLLHDAETLIDAQVHEIVGSGPYEVQIGFSHTTFARFCILITVPPKLRSDVVAGITFPPRIILVVIFRDYVRPFGTDERLDRHMGLQD